jgi:transcriptional regulator with XRE-family HTH domain
VSENELKVVASRIREARESLGLTQEEVSGALGIPRTSVHAMETGKRGVSALELRRLARLYRRSVEWLLGEEVEPPAAAAAADGALYRATRDLSEADKDQVLRFAEFLAAGAAPRGSDSGGDGR